MKKLSVPKVTVPNEHPKHSTKRQLIVSGLVLLFLIGVTSLVILYGKGYRLFLQEGEPKLTKTGLLNLTSNPTGAEVYVNDHLTAATNGELNLTPGKYTIKIKKDGYTDWQKDFEIQKEVVSDAEATLFPTAPSLQSISTFGIQSTIIDPTGTKLAFNIASDSAKKRNGIYTLDMTSRNFPVLAGGSTATQIADDSVAPFSKAKLTWSPDGKQILATIDNGTESPTYYLLDASTMNNTPQDITAVYTVTMDLWKQQREDKEVARIKALRPELQKFVKKNMRIISWSIDDNKILYQASQSADMPIFKKPRIIGNNHLYEQRSVQEGSIYVYNIKEDFNTRLLENLPKVCTVNDPECDCSDITKCSAPLSWFTDSTHLLYVNDKQIKIVEDDGSNMTTVYAGPFIENYVFPWPDGSKIVMLTNFNNSNVPPTLYSIGLR